jgi:hypothetical protein
MRRTGSVDVAGTGETGNAMGVATTIRVCDLAAGCGRWRAPKCRGGSTAVGPILGGGAGNGSPIGVAGSDSGILSDASGRSAAGADVGGETSAIAARA